MAGKRDFKRVVIISDLHCGHKVGLTPPEFDARYPKENREYALMRQRRGMWNFYKDEIEKLKPIDALIVNGDSIDGKGKRSGGTEHITVDRNQQVEMAATAILVAESPVVLMSYGTPYHTGADEDWEDAVARDIDAEKIGGHDYLDVNGLMMGYRHHVGSSSIPHGRYTQLAKQRMWDVFWAEYKEYPKSDVIIRSHVHYYAFCGGFGWTGFITPALQGYGSKFGTRKCNGTVDFGFIHLDVKSREEWGWKEHIKKFRINSGVVITKL